MKLKLDKDCERRQKGRMGGNPKKKEEKKAVLVLIKGFFTSWGEETGERGVHVHFGRLVSSSAMVAHSHSSTGTDDTRVSRSPTPRGARACIIVVLV